MQNDKNVISLLSEALKFYANEKNYENGMIEKDKGFHAQFILKMAKENQETLESYEKSYEDFIKRLNDGLTTDEAIKEVYDDINKLKG